MSKSSKCFDSYQGNILELFLKLLDLELQKGKYLQNQSLFICHFAYCCHTITYGHNYIVEKKTEFARNRMLKQIFHFAA